MAAAKSRALAIGLFWDGSSDYAVAIGINWSPSDLAGSNARHIRQAFQKDGHAMADLRRVLIVKDDRLVDDIDCDPGPLVR